MSIKLKSTQRDIINEIETTKKQLEYCVEALKKSSNLNLNQIKLLKTY